MEPAVNPPPHPDGNARLSVAPDLEPGRKTSKVHEILAYGWTADTNSPGPLGSDPLGAKASKHQ